MRIYTLDEMRQLILARKAIEEPLLDVGPASDAWLDANAVAHLAMLLQGEIRTAYDDMWPWSASSEALDRHAQQWLTVPRLEATPWSGLVTLTSSATEPPDVPAGLSMSATAGVEYLTTQAVGSGGIAWSGTAGAWTATPAAEAVEPGARANRADGTLLIIDSPPAGLASHASIYLTLASGTDAETDDRLRARILLAMAYRPGAGSPANYVAWAMEARADVARAYVYPRWELNDVRSVVVIPLRADPRQYYSPTELTQIRAYIETRRPVGADVNVLKPGLTFYTAATFDFVAHCRAGYGPDFVPPATPTVLVGSTRTRILHDQATYSVPVGARVVVYADLTWAAAQRVVIASGGGWVELNEALPADPSAGSPLDAGGPAWQPLHDAIVAWFCRLGPAISTDTTRPRFPPPSYDDSPAGLYRSDFFAVADAAPGVQAVVPYLPAFDADIPLTVAPGSTPTMYAISSPRIRLATAAE